MKLRVWTLVMALWSVLIAAAAPKVRIITPGSCRGEIEGVWLTAPGAALFELLQIPGQAGEYDMILLRASQPGVSEKVGTLRATAKPHVYEAVLAADLSRRQYRTRRFAAAVFPLQERMILTPYSQGWNVNLLRILPYLFRISVHQTDTRPALDGAYRLSAPVPAGIIEL